MQRRMEADGLDYPRYRASLREQIVLQRLRDREVNARIQISDSDIDVFLATDLTPGTPSREASEQDMVHRWVPDDELRRMVVEGAVVDATTLAALALLAHLDASA